MKEVAFPRPLLNLPIGKVIAPTWQVSLAIQLGQLGQSGRAIGTPQPQGSPVFPGEQHYLPGRQPHHHPPVGPQGSSMEEPNPKWVIHLSDKPLTLAQRSVLAKGPNFAVTPRQSPTLEYITAIEAACTKLSQQDAEELRADINRVLRSSHPPNPT